MKYPLSADSERANSEPNQVSRPCAPYTCAPPRTALAMRRRPLTVLIHPVRSSGRGLDLRAHRCANQWWTTVEER